MLSHSFEALTPTSFLLRSAEVFGERVAVIDGDLTLTYAELLERCRRLAGALVDVDVKPGARVAVLAPNSHEMLEAHYGVPFAGAVLVPLNIRLSAHEIAFILDHSGAEVLIHDESLAALAGEAISRAAGDISAVSTGATYEALLAQAAGHQTAVTDEQSPIAVNYTSGTTGRPKGAVYCHRGAYLQSLAMAYHGRLDPDSAYLWTLPMFHCNGWCFTWAVTAAGGRHVCLRKVEPAPVWQALDSQDITHLCAAPTVLTGMVFAAEATARGDRRVWVATGGAPPSPTLLGRANELVLDVTHLYGMTETYGPIVVNEWVGEWDSLPEAQRNRLKARQGVGNVVAQRVRVVDGQGSDVPRDGVTIGEMAVRGNDVMVGYYRDEEATAAAIPDGWFRTGDLAVQHTDGYVEIRDRAKDIIISGGENISSVEVEQALLEHSGVLEVAVVPIADQWWGERPVAFVTMKPGFEIGPAELREHLEGRLARFKIPDRFVFADLPKTATGKIQKFVLRDRLRDSDQEAGTQASSDPTDRPRGARPRGAEHV